MRKAYLFIGVLAFCLLSSFKLSKDCDYAESNIGYVRSQTQKAISENDINKARFLTYKALKAIEKSKDQLMDCGCYDAEKSMEESLENLKKATKATTIKDVRSLLNSALEKTLGSLDALEEYKLNENKYDKDVLVMNTVETSKTDFASRNYKEMTLHEKIDKSLENYRTSLNKIVETVECSEAKAFATRVFNNCQAELLKSGLSEGKKYYNLRTKEITAEALQKLKNCN